MKSELHCFENKIATIFIIAIFLFFIFVFIKHFDHIQAALWPKVSAQGEPCLYKTVGYITSPKDGTSTEIKGWVCPSNNSQILKRGRNMENLLLNSPTSKDFFKMNFKELLNNYWVAILVSIVFLIFAFNQNFFIDEVTYTLKLASIALAGLTFATFMIKINKIEDLSRKLTDDGVLTLINILSVYPEYVENVKAKLRKSNKLIVHDILIIRWDFNNQISEILKMGNFTSDKNKTDEISISSIEDLRTTKNKLSLLLVDLDISIKAQEAFTWKQSIQK